MEENWYAPGTDESAWYAPSESAETETPPKKKKKHRLLKTLAIILAILVLLAGGVYAVLQAHIRAAFAAPGSSYNMPSPDMPNGTDTEDIDTYDDFRDFFSDYYGTVETFDPCAIPLVSEFEPRTIEFYPAGDEMLPLQTIYAESVKSVVSIRAYPDETDTNFLWATGTIFTEDGYILTNAHAIAGTSRASVTLWNDESYDAMLVGSDSRSDIAVLKIDAHGLRPFEFFDSNALVVGDSTVAIGNPLGESFRNSMTEGIVSGIDRGVSFHGSTLTLIQTTTQINEGNSGGPLLNMYGQVVGIVNMKMSANSLGGASIDGIGFAIPSRIVKSVAESILRCGKVVGRPALGLTVAPISEEAREYYKLPEGLYVSDVSQTSDAYAKGIRSGDILLSADGISLKENNQLLDIIATKVVGDTISLRVWRQDGSDATVFPAEVALGEVSDLY